MVRVDVEAEVEVEGQVGEKVEVEPFPDCTFTFALACPARGTVQAARLAATTFATGVKSRDCSPSP